jgi:hypothetical protein
MLINKRYQKSIKRVVVCPGADIESDHNPLIRIFRFKRKQVISKNKNKAYNIFSLRDIRKCEILKDKLDKHIRLNNNNERTNNIKDQWQNIKDGIYNAVKKVLEYRKKVLKKEWITLEILDMMEERSLAKGNIQKYNHIH